MPDLIRIEGRGPVALALRLLLAREGVAPESVLADPVDTELPDWLGTRSLALSLGSLQTLARVVPQCSPNALLDSRGVAARIMTVDVTRTGASGGTRIEASQLGVPMLGAVIRYATLHRLLRDALNTSGTPPAPDRDATPAVSVVADGDPGESSSVRKREFDQSAVLAEVEVTRDRAGWAYERFTSEGPLALLPLPEPRKRALVWCAPAGRCSERAALSEGLFNAAFERAFGPLLGAISLCSPRHISPVTRRMGPLIRGATQVAIGNAAQSLHPVAGQGLNLGLRDAAVLARVLGDWQSQEESLSQAVARFAACRQTDREALVAVTDSLALLTCPDLLKPAHAAALGLLDLCTPLRNATARGLMFGLRAR